MIKLISWSLPRSTLICPAALFLSINDGKPEAASLMGQIERILTSTVQPIHFKKESDFLSDSIVQQIVMMPLLLNRMERK